jgi:predicted alpha/beta-hydrolase family hydrolase
VVEPAARFEEFRMQVPDPANGTIEVSAVLGIPRWWPTGSRVGVVLAHGAPGSQDEWVIESLHRALTERRYLALRFNFPFAEAAASSSKRRTRIDSPELLRRTLRAAVGALARDPTAAPARIFLIGRGLGARTVADASLSRLRADGLVLLDYPLHPPGKPGLAQADQLYRVVAPMLFLQGTRDRHCDVDVLRQTLTRVGAPTALHVVPEADHVFKVLKKSGRTQDEVLEELLAVIDGWIEKILGGG